MSSLDLSTLNNQQLKALAWELRGTPAVQPIYDELNTRPWRGRITPDDPDWDAKVTQILMSQPIEGSR
jgi:hypothetical protein